MISYIAMSNIIQSNFDRRDFVELSKIVINVHFCGPIKKQMFHNTSFHIFIEKSVCHDCALYDEYLGRIYQK